MKLRNKKTGEIVEPRKIGFEIYSFNERDYDSIAEFIEDWEDYEEPRDFWYINSEGDPESCIRNDELDKSAKEIGNYFETKEEAEKAAEKLKAWKRLRDKGLQPVSYTVQNYNRELLVHFIIEQPYNEKDLDLIFGGEE